MDLPLTLLPHHVADLETANAIRPPVGGAGLIIGDDALGRPVTVRLFDHEPRSYVVVGGLGLLQLIVVRLLALSCRITIVTERPAAWGSVMRIAAASSGALVYSRTADLPPGSPYRPSVLVVDGDSAVANDAPEGGAWSAAISGYDSLSQWNANVLDEVDAAIVQQLSPAEARMVETRLAVPSLEIDLEAHAPGIVGVVSRGRIVTARIRTTGFERWLLRSTDR